MAKYSHDFVENYDGFLGFGLDRKTDEDTVICYTQMFSDDTLMKELIKRMTDQELDEVFSMITKILKNHLVEPEYHELFLKEDDHHH